jgi:hypothetical protein
MNSRDWITTGNVSGASEQKRRVELEWSTAQWRINGDSPKGTACDDENSLLLSTTKTAICVVHSLDGAVVFEATVATDPAIIFTALAPRRAASVGSE